LNKLNALRYDIYINHLSDGRATHTLAPGTGRFFGLDLYQAQRLIPFPKLEPQELSVSIRDAKLYQTFDYLLTLPAAQ